MYNRTMLRGFIVILILSGCTAVPQLEVDIVAQTYHDPSLGWTAVIPPGWVMCNVPGGQFVRDRPLTDPTKLYLWSYKDRTVDNILMELEKSGGVINQTETGERVTPMLRWTRYRGEARDDSKLAVEFAIAADSSDTHLVLLVARKSEVDELVQSVLLPAVDSFVPGPPDPPINVLAVAPAEPDYWPTQAWRIASPESQGLDTAQLHAMLSLIDEESIPLDSLTIVRHGYMVLNVAFPPFESNQLHELHSATKSITSALVGIALHDAQMSGNETLSVDTPVLELFSARQVTHADERKRAITLKHVLTMTSGLEWKEWGAAYEPDTGNDLVLMIDTAPDWTQYVLDRPTVVDPGTTFLYNSGASHLLSAVVTELSGRSAADLAAERLFAPLGIKSFDWPSGPEGVTAGWANLRIRPEDLARIALLYLHRGAWDGHQIIPADWVEASTMDQVPDPAYEYGYQWWLDVADGYAFMAGRFGQVAIVTPRQDMVIVFTAHLPDTVSDVGVTRWLAEKFILPAAQ